MKTNQSLFVTNYVHQEEKTLPITGVHSPDFSLSGWICDRDFVLNERNSYSMFETFIGGQKHSLQDGTLKSDWNSIVLDGLKYLSFETFYIINDASWTPVYNRGVYSIYWNKLNLYSSFHYSGIMKEDEEKFYLELKKDCVLSSIEVAIWARDKNFVKYPYYSYQYASETPEIPFEGPFAAKGTYGTSYGYHYPLFTNKELLLKQSSFDETNSGKRYKEVMLDEIPDVIFYMPEQDSNIGKTNNTRNYAIYGKEGKGKLVRSSFYKIENNQIVTNGKKRNKIGTIEKDKESIEKFWENKSKSNPNGRALFSQFFPIKENSFKLVALSSSGNLITLEEVENINVEDDSRFIYQIDYDLGIIEIGGQDHSELLIRDRVEKESKEIFISEMKNLKKYPDSGILKIGSELVFYESKTGSSFFNCTRGYKGTVVESYEPGTKLKHIKNGKSIGSNYVLYCSYETSPKVRYEVSDKTYRYANKYRGFLDLKPINNIRENGIIQISSIDKHVSELELSIDADLIYGNIYGPIYYGTDYRRVLAKAKDSLGNPVDDIEITIKIKNGPGFLNYSLREYVSLSNVDGEVYSLYGVPYDWESISKRALSFNQADGVTEIGIEEIPKNLPAENIQLYQILKHDPILGTQGKKVLSLNPNGWGIMDTTYGKSYIDISIEDADIVSQFEGGRAFIKLKNGPNEYTLERNIAQSIRVDYGINGAWRFLLNESIPSLYYGYSFEYAILFEKEAENFSTVNLNGCRRVLYEWREDILNPATRELGAFYPVRPDAVSQTKLTFNKLLPLPKPNDINCNIGGYLIVCSDIAEFYAECVDPITGNIIRSNSLKMRIDIPAYLNGVSYKTGLPIPYGFKLIKDEFKDSSGIGGATFLTVNPFDFNVVDLMLEIN